MPSCDMCGKSGTLYQSLIEGTQLTVCEKCSVMGKILKPIGSSSNSSSPKKGAFASRPAASAKMVQVIVGDCAKRIRHARERLGLSQQQFASKLNERESYVQHLENGKSKPSVDVARKLERMLSITLIESVAEESDDGDDGEPTKASGTLTLGDIIKIRKR